MKKSSTWSSMQPENMNRSVPKKKGTSNVWIEVKEERKSIEQIHKDLYARFLKPHLRNDISYVPHVTIGSMGNGIVALVDQLSSIGFEQLRFKIDRLIVEEISESEDSATLKTIRLKEPS